MHPDTEKSLYLIQKRAKDKRKIVFVSGNFNILHPGHLRLLRFASECGDFLVVGVHGDTINGETLLDEKYRLEGVKSTTWVDFAFILHDTPEEIIQKLEPAIVVKGKEHEEYDNPEAAIIKRYGGKLLFSSGEINFSIADLLQNESERLEPPSLIMHDDFMKRHNFTRNDLCQTIKSFKDLDILVLGETIIDEYINCDPLGLSGEEPTIVVTPVDKEKYIGGAGIVAAHARNLGAGVSFFSVTGCDKTAQFAKSKLDEYKINSFIFEDESRPTILKQKFRSAGKSLLRVNHLRQHPISRELQKQIEDSLFQVLDGKDLLIFSDFNYGVLPQSLVKKVIHECRRKNIMMVADSQSSSQIGDVSRFFNMKLLTPTEREARLAIKDFESGLVVVAEKLRKKSIAENIFITLAEEGILIHADIFNQKKYHTDRLSAMNPTPKDPSGAGDSLLTCAAMTMASNRNIWISAYIGSIAAACQVERTGNIPISVNDLIKKLSE